MPSAATCEASSWHTLYSPKTVYYGADGLNRCVRDASHRGDHEDWFNQRFRLDVWGCAMIVSRGPVPEAYQGRAMHEEPTSRLPIHPEALPPEDQEELNSEFTSLIPTPGGLSHRLIRIIGVHEQDVGNPYGGPMRSVCTTCNEDYPCRTVRLALGVDF